MKEENLCFGVNDKIRIRGKSYIVKGKINFFNEADGCNWTEYKLVSDINIRDVKWLSIDCVYHEYAIYTESEICSEISIMNSGYHKVDEGIAQVMDVSGDIDADYAEKVSFKEFEDVTEEKIIGLEQWADEIECSVGYYLDADEIQHHGGEYTHNNSSYYSARKHTSNKFISIITAIIIVGFIIGIGKELFSTVTTINLSETISNHSQFTYVTSITADIDNKQKATVYETSLSVEEAAKVVLQLAENSVENVDENVEDGSVAIITDKYYCLVYQGEEGQTLVQVSTRRYVYSSRQGIYHGRSRTLDFYRGYYYTNAYYKDYERYQGVNAYEDYIGEVYTTDTNNRYKNYSDTIKQESVATRTSSGGGTNSGK